jgi:hypothetical protein
VLYEFLALFDALRGGTTEALSPDERLKRDIAEG